MKKIIAMLLAVVMVCALSVSAFALDATTGEATQNVNGSYVQATPEDAVYNITISWTTATFQYVVADKVWDAVDHVWEDPADLNGAFQAAAYSVTITNDSSAAITAYAVFADSSEEFEITGVLKNGDAVVNAEAPAELAAPIASNEGRAVTLNLSVSGTITAEQLEAVNNVIGTVTVTLGEAD